MRLIVQHFRPRRGESVVSAKAMHARAVSDALRVIGEADEVVREIEVAVDHAQLAFTVTAESGAWDDAEKPVGPVAILYGVTPALCFQVVNVVYVEGRADIHAGVCLGHRHSIHDPRHLMASVNVQNVMSQ